MQIRELNTEEVRMPAWVAKQDIARQDRENRALFSREQIAKADAIENLAEEVWYRCAMYRNYRQRFIAIKIEKPFNRRPTQKQMESLDQLALSLGAQIVRTQEAARIYRIPRQK